MIEVIFDVEAVRNALSDQAEALRNALENRIQQKLSGVVLQSRSGALAQSIVSSVDNEESDLSVTVSSVGVPYAAIQEFGGKTAAHEIIAVNAKVLAFALNGHEVFAKRVHHPGSLIQARSYLTSSLKEMRDEIKVNLKQAILDALR